MDFNNSVGLLLLTLLAIIAALHIHDWFSPKFNIDAKTKNVIAIVYGIVVVVAIFLFAGFLSL